MVVSITKDTTSILTWPYDPCSVLWTHHPKVKYIPAYTKGMGKAMPKDDSLIVPHNSRLRYGKPTAIRSNNVADSMQQIQDDLNALRETMP